MRLGALKDPPSAFQGGVNTELETSPLTQMPLPNPLSAALFVDDFFTFDSNQWTVTVVDGGGDTADTQGIADADGGVLELVNNDADDDSTFAQLAQEIIKLESGKQAWFLARIKVDNATESDLIAGITITDTTPLDATDGVFFTKADGSTDITCKVVKDSTATTSAALATAVDDTYVTLAWYYNGVDAVHAFVNGDRVAKLAVTNLPDDEEMAPVFGVQNGSAAARTFSIDQLLVAKER